LNAYHTCTQTKSKIRAGRTLLSAAFDLEVRIDGGLLVASLIADHGKVSGKECPLYKRTGFSGPNPPLPAPHPLF
jgi:hypothetical protein